MAGLFHGARLRRAGAVAAVAACAAFPAAAQEWKPTRNVDIVVSSGAGGAADRQARVSQRFVQQIPGIPSVTVTNRPGGAGLVAWTFVSQHPGDAHYISTLNVALVTNQVLGISKLRYQDLTPLNILMREYVAVWAHAQSQIASTKDLLARLKKDPSSVSFGFSPARGNQNHIVLGMLARAAGIDPKALKIVVYSSGGQGTTAALGGHVDVWAGTLGGALPHVATNAIRVFGVSAAQRQPGPSAALPTFKEQGIDAVYYAWRGFIAPGGLTAAQIAYWDQAFAKIVKEDEWKKVQLEHAWGEDFRDAAETRKHLDAEFVLLQKMLSDLGVTARTLKEK
ncbi:MAG: tripartite tricarboxylate transporter substrate binding protein [Burkholderiales bacterium]